MYLSWDKQNIDDFSSTSIDAMYDRGFVFTRPTEGAMEQTRSVRIDLSNFELSSENRRILKKTEGVTLSLFPLPYSSYDWSIGKLAKDFYETKFGDKTFSANKVKELFIGGRRDFNKAFVYVHAPSADGTRDDVVGYCIAAETETLVHYSYPFYDLEKSPHDMGLGMMLRALMYAKEAGKKYVYLGSAQRPSDTYKAQFSGFEWFDGKEWSADTDALKTILTTL